MLCLSLTALTVVFVQTTVSSSQKRTNILLQLKMSCSKLLKIFFFQVFYIYVFQSITETLRETSDTVTAVEL